MSLLKGLLKESEDILSKQDESYNSAFLGADLELDGSRRREISLYRNDEVVLTVEHGVTLGLLKLIYSSDSKFRGILQGVRSRMSSDPSAVTSVVLSDERVLDRDEYDLIVQESNIGGSFIPMRNQVTTSANPIYITNPNNNEEKKKGQFVCDYCHLPFVSKAKFHRHRRIHTEENPYICVYCNETFSHHLDLRKHRDEHHMMNKPFKCSYCPKTFATRAELRGHLWRHTGEKNHKCRICSKTFATKGNLKLHVDKHIGIHKHKCPFCPQRFTSHSSLEAHMAKHTGLKAYKCRFCAKSYAQAGQLTSHERLHTGEKPFVCEVCGKRFRLNSTRVSHEKRHSGARPHICDTCGRSFAMPDHLRRHMKIHENKLDRIVSCPFCKKKIFQGRNMRKHLFRHRELDLTEMQAKIISASLKPDRQENERGKLVEGQKSTSFGGSSKKSLQCERCSMELKSIRKLFDHLSKVHYQRELTPTERKEIRLRYGVQKLHHCQFCFSYFMDYRLLRSHVLSIHPEHAEDVGFTSKNIARSPASSHKCPNCSMFFDLRSTLDEHVIKDHLTTVVKFSSHVNDQVLQFRCWYCADNFHTPEEVVSHMTNEHESLDVLSKRVEMTEDVSENNVSSTGLWACPHCPLNLKTEKDYKRHLSLHSQSADSSKVEEASAIMQPSSSTVTHPPDSHIEDVNSYLNSIDGTDSEASADCVVKRYLKAGAVSEKYHIPDTSSGIRLNQTNTASSFSSSISEIKIHKANPANSFNGNIPEVKLNETNCDKSSDNSKISDIKQTENDSGSSCNKISGIVLNETSLISSFSTTLTNTKLNTSNSGINFDNPISEIKLNQINSDSSFSSDTAEIKLNEVDSGSSFNDNISEIKLNETDSGSSFNSKISGIKLNEAGTDSGFDSNISMVKVNEKNPGISFRQKISESKLIEMDSSSNFSTNIAKRKLSETNSGSSFNSNISETKINVANSCCSSTITEIKLNQTDSRSNFDDSNILEVKLNKADSVCRFDSSISDIKLGKVNSGENCRNRISEIKLNETVSGDCFSTNISEIKHNVTSAVSSFSSSISEIKQVADPVSSFNSNISNCIIDSLNQTPSVISPSTIDSTLNINLGDSNSEIVLAECDRSFCDTLESSVLVSSTTSDIQRAVDNSSTSNEASANNVITSPKIEFTSSNISLLNTPSTVIESSNTASIIPCISPAITLNTDFALSTGISASGGTFVVSSSTSLNMAPIEYENSVDFHHDVTPSQSMQDVSTIGKDYRADLKYDNSVDFHHAVDGAQEAGMQVNVSAVGKSSTAVLKYDGYVNFHPPGDMPEEMRANVSSLGKVISAELKDNLDHSSAKDSKTNEEFQGKKIFSTSGKLSKVLILPPSEILALNEKRSKQKKKKKKHKEKRMLKERQKMEAQTIGCDFMESCCFCSDIFKNKTELGHHLKVAHTNEDGSTVPFRCWFCTATFTSPEDVVAHMTNMHDNLDNLSKRVEMAELKNQLATEKESCRLKLLKLDDASLSPIDSLKCPKCPKKLESKEAYELHMIVHEASHNTDLLRMGTDLLNRHRCSDRPSVNSNAMDEVSLPGDQMNIDDQAASNFGSEHFELPTKHPVISTSCPSSNLLPKIDGSSLALVTSDKVDIPRPVKESVLAITEVAVDSAKKSFHSSKRDNPAKINSASKRTLQPAKKKQIQSSPTEKQKTSKQEKTLILDTYVNINMCTHCSRVFCTKRALDVHTFKMHGKEYLQKRRTLKSSTPFNCWFCSAHFPSPELVVEHMTNSHENLDALSKRIEEQDIPSSRMTMVDGKKGKNSSAKLANNSGNRNIPTAAHKQLIPIAQPNSSVQTSVENNQPPPRGFKMSYALAYVPIYIPERNVKESVDDKNK